jgi:AbrB family looped-hinge helix DNA binding protein
MKDILVTMDQAGRIVLPENVREALGVKSGDLLKVSVDGKSLTLTPGNQKAGLVRKGKALVFSTRDTGLLSLETVNVALEEGREELAFRNAGGIIRRKREV